MGWFTQWRPSLSRCCIRTAIAKEWIVFYFCSCSGFCCVTFSFRFAAAIGMWFCLPEHKWVARFLLLMAVLIAVATVYGRYHYVADVLAGLLMTAVAVAVARFRSSTSE
jgi:hypothetical protein